MRKMTIEFDVPDNFIMGDCSSCPFSQEIDTYDEDDGFDSYRTCSFNDCCPKVIDDGLEWHMFNECKPQEDGCYLVELEPDGEGVSDVLEEAYINHRFPSPVKMWASVKKSKKKRKISKRK